MTSSSSSSFRSMALLTLFCLLVVALNAQTTSNSCLLDNVDLVFVLENSGSIRPTDFTTALTGLTYFVNGLKSVGPRPGQSRVGMVSFSDTGRVEFGLDRWSTADQVDAAILNVTYIGGGANISDGMRVAREEVYESVPQNGHARLMLVITDGHDSSNVTAEGWLLHNAGVTVYAIGIGEDIDTAELVRVAGSPSRVVVLTSWLNLTSIWEKICTDIDSGVTWIGPPTVTFPLSTSAPWTTTGGGTPSNSTHLSTPCPSDSSVWPRLFLDILLVVDTTVDVSQDGLALLEIIIYSTIGRFTVGQSGSQTRVGLLSFGDKTELVYDFTAFKTTADALAGLNKFLRDASNFNSVTTNITAGINDAAGYISSAGRHGFGQIMVVLTPQTINCSDNGPRREIFTIALESATQQQSTVVDLGNSPCTIFSLSDPSLQDQLLTQFSYANCYCKDAGYVQVRGVDATDCRRYTECVWLSDTKASEAGAESGCDDTLAIVNDQIVQNFLNSDPFGNQSYYPYWIGLKGVYPNLQWQDGTPLSDGDYTPWAIQPTPGQQICVWMQLSGLHLTPKWYPQNCSQSAYFICQEPACTPNNVACS